MNRGAVREIVLGLWKIHILHHASEGGVVGNHLLQELRQRGYDVSPGTLYPLLHRMERNGWLRSQTDDSGPKAPRSYELTAAGREILQLVSPFVNVLHRELSAQRSEEAAANLAARGEIQ
jgi:DNA-binding PadR family transcriptional regulator